MIKTTRQFSQIKFHPTTICPSFFFLLLFFIQFACLILHKIFENIYEGHNPNLVPYFLSILHPNKNTVYQNTVFLCPKEGMEPLNSTKVAERGMSDSKFISTFSFQRCLLRALWIFTDYPHLNGKIPHLGLNQTR